MKKPRIKTEDLYDIAAYERAFTAEYLDDTIKHLETTIAKLQEQLASAKKLKKTMKQVTLRLRGKP